MLLYLFESQFLHLLDGVSSEHNIDNKWQVICLGRSFNSMGYKHGTLFFFYSFLKTLPLPPPPRHSKA